MHDFGSLVLSLDCEVFEPFIRCCIEMEFLRDLRSPPLCFLPSTLLLGALTFIKSISPRNASCVRWEYPIL